MNLLVSFFVMCLASVANVPVYHIQGHVADIEDGTVLYLRLVGPPSKDIDSVVVRNGNFEYRGNAPKEPTWATLSIKGKFSSVGEVYLEKGEIRISGKIYNTIVKGTHTNNENEVFKQTVSPMYGKRYSLGSMLAENDNRGAAYRDSMNNVIKTYDNQIDKAELNYIKTYPKSVIALRLLEYKSSHMNGMQLNSAIALLDKSMQNREEVVRMKHYAKQLLSCSEGTAAPDFTLPNSTGGTFTLSSAKGKYVLIDFWASWCASCRNALPSVAALNKKYEKANFLILGLSLDRSDEAWRKALKQEGCSWLQVCDYDGKVAHAYAVSAIPLTIIVGPDGRIVSRGLQKDALEKKLDELLKIGK